MGIFSKLFGSDKVIDAGIAGIDKAFYTKEEQADMEIKKAHVKMAFMKLYEPFKLAQRFMMLIIGIPYVSIHVILSLTWLVALFVFMGSSESYDFVVSEIKNLGEMNNETLGLSFLTVVSFYFCGGMLEGAIGKYANVKAAGVKK